MSRPSSKPACAAVRPVAASASPAQAVRTFAAEPEPAILETVRPGGPFGRYSILACDPVDTFRFSQCDPGCPVRALQARTGSLPVLAAAYADDLPFAGGWIGYFTYEAGLRTEGIPTAIPDGDALPLARFHLYDHAAIYDHEMHAWSAVAVDWPGGVFEKRSGVDARLRRVAHLLEAAAASGPALPLPPPASAGAFTGNLTKAGYLERVQRLLGEIRDGNVYQVNLTQRFTARVTCSPLDLYLRLRQSNPASHAALLPGDDGAVISSSPELFLDVRDGRVVTRPIKGTRPRVGDDALDTCRRRELASAEKDRAELNMIIDLLRNDLGRVCETGSVRVEHAGDIEAHPTVFHRVATVSGRVGASTTWADLLVATLPGGSITGAPKIAAMKLIHALEPTQRSAYCGVIGYLDLAGRVSMNLAIRTMVQHGRLVHAYAGGGIVADSDPEDEWDECMAKARGMLTALGVVPHAEEGIMR